MKIKVRSILQQALDDLNALASAKKDEEIYIDQTEAKAQVLLDYITNLQEDIKAYKQERKNLLNSIQDIQKENKRLKELDENYPIEEQLAEALKYENIYKSRNEKAVEYLNKHSNNLVEFLYTEELEELSKILQGSDKE